MHESSEDLSRRGFLKFLGASVALAGLDGCTRMPADKIIPFVNQPPELTPGIPVHYATSMVLDGFATGLIVEAHEGRPTKIEGNPGHPASLGAAGIFEQASLLQLYDPDRARRVREGRTGSTWNRFCAAMAPEMLRKRVGTAGERLALLLEPTSSPLIAAQLDTLRALYPDLRVYYYAPLHSRAADSAFTSTGLLPQYDLEAADVIVSASSDFLANGPFNLRYARQFAERRRSPADGMNRLYVMESAHSVTGGAADHRLACTPTQLHDNLHLLLGAVRGQASSSAWVNVVADDLRAHRGRSVVIPGARQPAAVHALCAAINDALANTGQTTWFTQSPILGAGSTDATLDSLLVALQAKAVDTLVILGGNPVYASPAEMTVASLFGTVPNCVYAGLYENETARDAQWFVPGAHYLEAWGDARAYDGAYSIVQPLVRPLHGGKSVIEILSALCGQRTQDPLTLLKAVAAKNGVDGDEQAWTATLGRGFVSATSVARLTATPRPEMLAPAAPVSFDRDAFAIVLEPDARVHDGSFANNAWLQELPDPVTKLTWDNAALIAPGTAQRLAVATGDVLEIRRNGAVVHIPAIVVNGTADGTIAVHLGYGRRGGETVAAGVGVNVAALWPGNGAFDTIARVTRFGDAPRALAITQQHWSMEGGSQARSTPLAAYLRSPSPPPKNRRALQIYEPQQRLDAPRQWAMTIDLGTCIGCSACVVACQAENNIPVVGRDDVAKSREMHWLRIDRYLEDEAADARVVTQPMLCQHCENAPCEYVCPVGATEHSADGLNEMVYNRCVGTRFCSNNCPYKVRRFNWLDYNAHLSDTEQMAKNPDVTVRERGVMEKCTFCVQRIREAEIAAGVEGRALRGDEVQTACQQSCPTNAIVFGSLTEPESEMMKRRQQPRAYSVLEELGTNPRVEYLVRVRNINPRLERA
jgi:molybdopterin-containing oxidoreductase family iron-sulfur binding subunit